MGYNVYISGMKIHDRVILVYLLCTSDSRRGKNTVRCLVGIAKRGEKKAILTGQAQRKNSNIPNRDFIKKVNSGNSK